MENQFNGESANEEVDPELSKIPYYLRERVQDIINQKVESRVATEMAGFKEEVMRELDDQRMQNQLHIAHYLEHPYHKGNQASFPQSYAPQYNYHPGMVGYGGYGWYAGYGGYYGGYPYHPYGHHPGYYGHPGPRQSASKSP